MGFVSVLTMAQELAAQRIEPGDCCIDATAGNGVDTLFLAKEAGPKGLVHAFDVQETALASTAARLSGEQPERSSGVRLHLASHDRMKEYVDAEPHGRISAVMFNLGYLPGAEHHVITQPGTTLTALDSALELLRPGGMLTVVVYSGHPGGAEEAEAVNRWAESLAQREFQVMCYRFMNQRNSPPYLIAVEKRQAAK
ncbi:MAG: SAM-dependent methyltransferase [Paenibacillaceae bacterium]|jgi:predicted methyltransferase|nr:SAM-dependent methyltransferase [Paenibacillaceae bacterium]